MNSISDSRTKQYGGLNITNLTTNGDVFESMVNNNAEAEAKQRAVLVEWLNSILPNLNLPIKASDEEMRVCLADGTVLCRILNRLRPGSVNEVVEMGGDSDYSSASRSENVKRFLATMDELGIPRFAIADLEKGSMKTVMDCLLTLRAQFMPVGDNSSISSTTTKSGSPLGDGSPRGLLSPLSGEEKRKFTSESKFQRALRSPLMSEPSAALMHHVGHKFHEVFQLRQGRYADLPAAKISEMMKSNSLDNAPTQSLLSVVNGILDESVERKNGEIPHRVACLLRKVVQEIERRISTQAEHLRTQNNLFKAREEKYQSRIRVLEALASGTGEEARIVMNQLLQVQTENLNVEEKKKLEEEDVVKLMKVKDEVVVRLMKEKDQYNLEISALKQELDIAKKTFELRCLQVETEAKGAKVDLENRLKELERLLVDSRTKETEAKGAKVDLENKLKQFERLLADSSTKETKAKGSKEYLENRLKELERLLADSSSKEREAKSANIDLENRLKDLERLLTDSSTKETEATGSKVDLEKRLKELERLLADSCTKETKAKSAKVDLEHRLKELERLLADSSTKVKELEAHSDSKSKRWNKKESSYKRFMDVQIGALRGLRFSSESIKQEIIKTQNGYSEEFNRLGVKLKTLVDAAENYHAVLAENRKMFNELQDLKGNIRVYCRVRPFLPGQTVKQTTIESIGEYGELVVANPGKPGKDGHRPFKFNKVLGPAATQAEVFSDIQPMIRSVLDGYNVCIFAYGQTGSGKTYTMTGPTGASEEDWGVNYRALNDLFKISQNRRSSFMYEVVVQMIEIYNEQVRDLLSNDASQKKLGIMSTSQPNGLAVPDASMHPVRSTSDVMEIMDIGLKNRAVGATALNERSSRSHSVVTIHVRGKDLKTGSGLHGNLHLVDLAGSERIDRSEVTGDRLREAQHINKSLSALGDVIFALAQKSSHVPYRNSKLTQVLQSALGGQAKTLMFVQLNPDVNSYSESMSTLKFAERVSGVELGAARSSKEGRDVKELMEQVASLKDTIGKKDDEIERLQLLKDLKNVYPGINGEKRGTGSLRYGSSSPKRDIIDGTTQPSQKPSGGKGLGLTEKIASDSDHSDKHSEADSQQSMDDYKQQNEFLRQSNIAGGNIGQIIPADAEILGFWDGDYEESLSDISDGSLSMGTDPDGSAEYTESSEGTKPSDHMEKRKPVSKISRHPSKAGQTASKTVSVAKDPLKVSTSIKKTATGNSSLLKPPRRWQ